MGANDKLRNARLRKNVDQEQLALKLDVSTSTYARWEQGRGEPTLANLRALCRFFRLPPEELGYVIYEERPASATMRDQTREQVL